MPVQSFPVLSLPPCCHATALRCPSLSHSPRLRNNPPSMSPLVGSEWLSRRFIYPLAGISDMSRFMSAAIRRMFGFPFPGQPGYHRPVVLASTLAIPPAASISSLFQQSFEATNDSQMLFQATMRRVLEGYHPAILRGPVLYGGHSAILLSPGRYELGRTRPVNNTTPALYPLVPRLRVVFWNRIAPFHREPRSNGRRTGEIADGVSQRWP